MKMKDEDKSRLICTVKRRIGKTAQNCYIIRIAGRLQHKVDISTIQAISAFISGLKMSTAVHNLVKDLHKFQNLDSGIEGNFPVDAAVTESQAPFH